MTLKLAGLTAGILSFVLGGAAQAAVTFNINVNGSGSYSIDGGNLVTDNGVLTADPSSTIGVDVLTFAFPIGEGIIPGDVRITNPFNNTTAALVRFTDAAGDLFGNHDLDRIILYSTALDGNPADTGLPANAGGSNIFKEDVNGFIKYAAGPNVYNIQLDTPVSTTPLPAALPLLGSAIASLAGVGLRNRRLSRS